MRCRSPKTRTLNVSVIQSGPTQRVYAAGNMAKLDKGPEVVLQALLSGDPEQVAEALAFQRKSFKAKFGCYPEELVLEDVDDDEVPYVSE
jgi:hypothetical protein